MSSQAAEADELQRLQAFASGMKKETYAYRAISDAILAIKAHILSLDIGGREMAEFSVKIKIGDTSSLILNRVSRECSLLGLKQLILGGVEGEHGWLHRNSAVRLHLLGPGASAVAPVLLYDDRREGGERGARTLRECNVGPNAVLAVSLCDGGRTAAMQTDEDAADWPGAGAEEAGCGVETNPVSHGHCARSAFLALALALHLQVTRVCGLTCMVEAGGRPVPGFAPSLRELASSKVAPDGWDADPTVVTLTYRHRSRPGALFVLAGKLDARGSDALFSFSKKAAKDLVPACSQELRGISSLVYCVGASFSVRAEQALFEWFLPLVERQLPGVGATAPPAVAVAAAPAQQTVASTFNAHAAPLAAPSPGSNLVSPPLAPRAPAAGVDRGFASSNPDLEPDLRQTLPGTLRIPGVGSDRARGAPGRGPDGMLVGPDSDMFRGGDDDDEFGYPQAPGFEFEDPAHPSVRYDPLLPPGPGLRVPGRGQGRGGRHGVLPGRSQFPGEPNPDHLKPPGW